MDDIHLNCTDYINKGKICYSCGKLLCENNKCKRQPHCKISKTLDHIPPKGLFEQNKGYPNIISNPEKNKITVPCCKECNNKYSKDEETFLFYITLIAARYSKIADYALKSNRFKSFKKNKAMRNLFFSNMRGPIDINTKSGIYVERGVIFGLNKDKEIASIQNILKKIVKGFYYKYTKTFLDKEVYYGEDNIFLRTDDGFHYKTKNVIYANEKKTIYNLLADNKTVYDENSNSKIEVYGENIKSDIFYYGFIMPQNEKGQSERLLFVLRFYNSVEFILYC